MKKTVDARGLVCPAPVLETREILTTECPEEIMVVVDNAAAKENVSRFLQSQGYGVEEVAAGDDFQVTGRRGEGATVSVSPIKGQSASAETSASKILVLIMTETIGRGDDSLGRNLMINYIKTLEELGPELWQLIFVNGGVALTCEDSPVLAEIQQYEVAGTTVLSCGTCMEHFGITDKKAVGGLTNMLDIVMATQNADKVITLG